MAVFSRRRIVNLLRLCWVFSVFWYEIGIFLSYSRSCNWPGSTLYPETPNNLSANPVHVLLVADPQIIDHHSYPSRGVVLSYLTRFIVDLNLRKNWLVALRKEPDAVVFLGDMMDNGRYDMSDDEYEAYYVRFKDIFRLPSNIPHYYIPGNHDIGLGKSLSFSSDARARYVGHFGQPNQVRTMANHSLVFFDAPSYADEDALRHSQRKSLEDWIPIRNGSFDFVKKFADQNNVNTDPVILFSHIPLFRSDGKSCGPLRERGTLRPGVGPGYQNTLEKQSSLRLLEVLKPVAVFSGDDHDYCEYTHVNPYRGSPSVIPEISVKTLSMVMNIRRPGFQLLSLAPSELRKEKHPTYADVPCFLPDQIAIYLNSYVPLLLISIVIVLASNFYKVPHSFVTKHSPNDGHGPFILPPSSRNGHNDNFGDIEEAELSPYYTSFSTGFPFANNSNPQNSSPRRLPGWFELQSNGRRNSLSLMTWYKRIECLFFHSRKRLRARRHSWLASSILDVRDIAIFPIAAFLLVTWFVVS